ncbi:hypothetical protein DFH09DRAFT_1114144 [Mycena vulgaris]|nr:hypothetical protein DFH09DRAFT_1114144 [Mycena vulgaris]
MYPPTPPRNPSVHSSFVDHTPFALPLASTTRIEEATPSQLATPGIFWLSGTVLPPPPAVPNPAAQRVARGPRAFTVQRHEYHAPYLDPLPGPEDNIDWNISWAELAHQTFAAAAVARFYDAMFFGAGEFSFGGFFVRETRNWNWGQLDLREVFAGRATAIEEARAAFERDPAEAVRYLAELIKLEHLLHFVAHNGVRVFMHPGIRRAQLAAYRLLFLDAPEHVLEEHLDRLRGQDNIRSSPQARTSNFFYTVYLLDETWVDPRVGWEAGPSFQNPRDRWLRFDSMLEFLDRFAGAGFALPDGGLEGEDLVFDEPAAILEGAALEEYLASLPLRPLNVYGAAPLPLMPPLSRALTPLPAPSPTPNPSPPLQEPIEVSASESSSDESFIRMPCASPPRSPTHPIPSRRRRQVEVVIPRRRGHEPLPVPDTRKRARMEDVRPRRVFRRRTEPSPRRRSPSPVPPPPRRRTATGPRADRERPRCAGPRSATRPSTPPPVPPPRASALPRRAPAAAPPRSRRRRVDPPLAAARPLARLPGVGTRRFPGEAYRPVGEVVRGLVPECAACCRDGRICSICAGPNDRNAPWSREGRFACDTCSANHASCAEWARFRDGYLAHRLEEFSFQFWEHLGGGEFVPLEVDHRLRSLNEVAQERSFPSFCYGLQPLLNAQRSRVRQRRIVSPPPPFSSSPHPSIIEVSDDSEEDLPCATSKSCGKGKAVAKAEEDEMEVDELQSDVEEGEWRAPQVRITPRATSPVITLEDFDLDAEPVSPPPLAQNVAGPSSARANAGPSGATNPSPSRAGGLFSTGPSIVVPPPAFLGMSSESLADPREYGPHTLEWDAQALLQFYESNPVEHRLDAHEYMESVLQEVGSELRRRRAGQAQGSGGAKGKGKEKEKAL